MRSRNPVGRPAKIDRSDRQNGAPNKNNEAPAVVGELQALDPAARAGAPQRARTWARIRATTREVQGQERGHWQGEGMAHEEMSCLLFSALSQSVSGA